MCNVPNEKKAEHRPDISNARLLLYVALTGLVLIAFFCLKIYIPGSWQRPGSGVLQITAAVGAVLLLVPFGFSIGKRGTLSRVPNRLFILHVNASLLGVALVGFHAIGNVNGPPVLLLVCLLVLIVTGVVARVRIGRAMASTFASKLRPFGMANPEIKTQIRGTIEAKKSLLRQLDPNSDEAIFSVTLFHWLKSPRHSLRYHRLVQREARLMGARSSVPFMQGYWRPLHLLAAWLFLLGLLGHIVVVLLFAGYAAGGGEIYWWHIAAW